MSAGFSLADAVLWASRKAKQEGVAYVVYKKCDERCAIKVLRSDVDAGTDWNKMHVIDPNGTYRGD